MKGKTSRIRGVRRLRSTKEPQLVVRLPARVRTGLKHGHGPLEDRIIVLGRLEVDDIPRGIDEVTEQRQLFREPPAVGRLVDPRKCFGEERLETLSYLRTSLEISARDVESKRAVRRYYGYRHYFASASRRSS